MSSSLSPLLAPMLSSAAMRAICDDLACLQHMLDFEAALARAEALAGVIPTSAAGPIAEACQPHHSISARWPRRPSSGRGGKQAVAGQTILRDVLAGNPRVTAHLDAETIARLFEPMAYQGGAQALIDRLLASLDHQ